MLSMRVRLGEVAVAVFQFFILVAVPKLAMNVWIVHVWLRLFLLHCALGCVTVVLRSLGHAGGDVRLRTGVVSLAKLGRCLPLL